MSRIVITAKSFNQAELVGVLRKLLPQAGVFDVKDALTTGSPLLDREVFDDDWADAHEQVRTVLAELKRRDVPFELYELQEGQTIEGVPHNRIDERTLENILASFPEGAGAT